MPCSSPRILFLSPSNAIGGAEMSLLSMVKYFNERNYGIYVALPKVEKKNFENQLTPYAREMIYVKSMAWNKPLRQMGFRGRVMQYLYAGYKSGGWHIAPVAKLCRFIRKNHIDIVHTNTLLSLDGAFAAKICGIPHVQHLREPSGKSMLSIVEFPFQKYPDLFRKGMNWLHAKVIANSDFTKENSHLFFPSKKLIRIYNPIEEWYFNEDMSNKACNYYQNPFRIGMVANVTAKWKNHELFIDVAKSFIERNPGTQSLFEIYGRLPHKSNPYFVLLNEKIRACGLENVVLFKGRKEDPLEIYEGMDALIHPTNKEAFGRIYVEAMAQGIPVVALKGGGATELIADGETGLLVYEPKCTLFAEKLEWLLSHPKERQIMTEKAFRFAQQFRPTAVLPPLERVYAELLSRQSEKSALTVQYKADIT